MELPSFGSPQTSRETPIGTTRDTAPLLGDLRASALHAAYSSLTSACIDMDAHGREAPDLAGAEVHSHDRPACRVTRRRPAGHRPGGLRRGTGRPRRRLPGG